MKKGEEQLGRSLFALETKSINTGNTEPYSTVHFLKGIMLNGYFSN
jgi:hypothetical protein